MTTDEPGRKPTGCNECSRIVYSEETLTGRARACGLCGRVLPTRKQAHLPSGLGWPSPPARETSW